MESSKELSELSYRRVRMDTAWFWSLEGDREVVQDYLSLMSDEELADLTQKAALLTGVAVEEAERRKEAKAVQP